MPVQFSNKLRPASVAAESFIARGGKLIFDKESLVMDLLAADGHNGNEPIDWDKLHAAPPDTFMHDVGGIQQHMDRNTGSLGHFLPRCAKVEQSDTEPGDE